MIDKAVDSAVLDGYFLDIADAIRGKGGSGTYSPAQMAQAIENIQTEPNLQTKSVTPTESAQVITPDSGYDGLEEVDVGAISSSYVGSGITRRSSSDLTASGATVNVPAGYYQSQASKAVASGTEGTPTAQKGSVSNHKIAVTPKVTNGAGYIAGGEKTGNAVEVSASELVSGSETKTENGTYDVTNLASLVVNVSGGSSGAKVGTATKTLASASTSIQFTGLLGEPTSFVVVSSADLATGASPFKTAAVVFDGTNLHAQTITNTNNAQVSYDGTNFSKTYSNGTLTITGSTNWQANEYKLVYSYGGSAGNIGTQDVHVGSGATSITFTGLTDEPTYFSCIFKSNFGTSSGYQRVITVVYDGNDIYGLAMDSGAKVSTAWTYTYNNGSLTITSQGTNNGGYFHQPGYYQLTYMVGGEPPEIQTEPITITQNGTYTAPSGKAYTPVIVNVSGGSSKNAQTAQSTTRAASTSYTEVISLTCAVSGTYDVYWSTFRSSTSGTWGSQLYINDEAYGTADTGNWSNHVQNEHLTGVQLSANDEVAIRVRSRGNSYYGYVGTLTIKQTA